MRSAARFRLCINGVAKSLLAVARAPVRATLTHCNNRMATGRVVGFHNAETLLSRLIMKDKKSAASPQNRLKALDDFVSVNGQSPGAATHTRARSPIRARQTVRAIPVRSVSRDARLVRAPR